MPGQRCNSTRVEIAGAIMAMVKKKALHIGTDSAAMLGKALKLKEAATKWTHQVQQKWMPTRNPFRKPWGLQTDGDLWEVMWEQ